MYKNRINRVLALIMIFSMILTACNSSKKSEPTATTAPQATQVVAATEAPAPTDTQAAKATEAPVATSTTAAAEPTATEAMAEDPWANVDPSGQTISFWHNHTGDRVDTLQKIVDDFNSTNPYGITVDQEYQGSYNDIFNKMLTFINTPDVPGVVVAYQNQAATYQIADALVDMNPLVASAKWGLTQAEQADFFPGFWQQDIFPMFNGARLGFPPNRSMEVLYYNADWLAELKSAGLIDFDGAPQTPEQFKQAACAAAENPFSKNTGATNIGYEYGTNDASHMAAWTYAFGGDIFDFTSDEFTYNSDGAKQALSFIQDLFKSGCATIIAEAYGDQTDFGTGSLLFTTSSSSGLLFYQQAVSGGANFNWSVAAIPHTTADPVLDIYGASVSIPKSTPEKELASWLFIKYYTSPEVQAEWAKVSGYFPVRASVAEGMADYFAANPAYEAGFNLLQYGHFEPPVPGYDFVRNKVNEAAAAILADPYPDVGATLDALNPVANDLLKQQMALIPEPDDAWYKVKPDGQTITFWHNKTGPQGDALQAIIDEFNASNAYGITVNGEYQGGYNDVFNKMLGVLNTADAPDLVVAYQNQAATYQVADALVDMNSLVKSYKWGLSPTEQSDFFKGFFAQDIFPNFNNARLGFPPNRSEEVLFYNADWLAELKTAGAIDFDGPPQTPEQFKAAACAAAETPFSKNAGSINVGYEYGTTDASHLAAWAFAFGGDIYDYKANQFTYNSDAAVQAMTFIQDLFKSGCATIIAEAYGDQTDFGTGSLLFTTSSSSGLPFYTSAVSDGANFNWSVGAIPHTTKDPAMNIYGASVSMPKTTPERELATWLFVKYYTSPEVQATWAEASGYFPVRASVAANMADYFASNPAYKTGFDLLQYGKFEPPVPGYDPIRNEANTTVAAILADPYPDVKAALDALTQKANDILSQYMTIVPTPEPTTAP